MRLRVAALIAMSLCGGSGCYTSLSEEKPDPPAGTEEVVLAYEEPDLALTESSVPRIKLALDQRFKLFSALCGWNSARDVSYRCDGILPLIASVNALSSAGFYATIPSEEEQEPVEDLNASGEGFVRLHRICSGATGDGPADRANGELELIAGFTEQGLDGIAFGSFMDCQLPIERVPVTLNGDYSVTVAKENEFTSLIIILDVTLDAPNRDRQTIAVDLSFIIAPNRIGVRLPTSNNQSLILFNAAGDIGFFAENGTWECDEETDSCQESSSGAVVPFQF